MLFQPLVNLLLLFYRVFFNNMGVAIIVLTAAIRLVLLPITSKQLKAGQTMKKLAPELEKLKKQYGDDKQRFAQEQLKLYQKHGANPIAGCLPTIIQFAVLIALYQALSQVLLANGDVIGKLNETLYSFLRLPTETHLNMRFLYLNIDKPDTFLLPFSIKVFNFTLNQIPGLFLIGAAMVQFLSSKMLMPAKSQLEKAKEKKEEKEGEDMAGMMQSQMLYLAPLMTLVIGFRFPSGLVLYWFSFSLFMLAQQLFLKKEEARK